MACTPTAAPVLSVDIVTSTTINLRWAQHGISVDRYTVSYNHTVRQCGGGPVSQSMNISAGSVRNFTLRDIQEDSDYTIALTAYRGSAQVASNQVQTRTNTAGMYVSVCHDCGFL